MMTINRTKYFFSRVQWIAIPVIFWLITSLSVKSEERQLPKEVYDRFVQRAQENKKQLQDKDKLLQDKDKLLQDKEKQLRAAKTELEKKGKAEIDAEAKKNIGGKSLNKEKLRSQINSRKSKRPVSSKQKVKILEKGRHQTTSSGKKLKKPENAPEQMDYRKTFKGFGFQIPTIRPGNTITITITAGTSKSTTLTVQTDGEISMQEFGKLIAAGKTTTELAHDIEDILIKPEYSPVVKVEIDKLNN